jgi:hypothetical protein
MLAQPLTRSAGTSGRLTSPIRPPGRPKATRARAHPRRWRQILTDALTRQDAVSVRGTVIDHLRRTPTRAEIAAARRAAHGLAASGQATILRVRSPGFDGPGSAHLILARPGAAIRNGSLDELVEISIGDKARQRFEATVLVKDLAISVELLSVAIEAIPADRLSSSDAGNWSPLWTHPSTPYDGSDAISDACTGVRRQRPQFTPKAPGYVPAIGSQDYGGQPASRDGLSRRPPR